MFVLLGLWMVRSAAACSCWRPPFDVVGAPPAAPQSELVAPRPELAGEPDLIVPPSPVLTITRLTRASGFPPETRAGTARFVRLDTGARTAAVTVRRRSPEGVGGHVQLDVRPARPLDVGATYAIEMWSYPGSPQADWYGVRMQVRSNADPAGPIPRAVTSQFTPPSGGGSCAAAGWTLLVGDAEDPESTRSRFDLLARAPDGRWRFWGTFAGPVVGNTGSMCGNYAYGSDAPLDAASVRVIPRDLDGRFGAPVEITPPVRP